MFNFGTINQPFLSPRKLIFFCSVVLFAVVFSCVTPEGKQQGSKTPVKDTLVYFNHADSAKYVGINTCKQCHADIYNSFIKTGMGKSFDVASRQKSSGDYHTSVVHDKIGDFYYKAFWQNDSLRFLEYRLKGKDTIYKRQETVTYIVGSGQHTNSHIQSVNGYLNQMPMTFYTQKKTWDLPPGFEDGHNSRFMRKIGLECMSCHNSYPDFVLGSENKYKAVDTGIGCERCHGPGSMHVNQRQTTSPIDTSKYIDYSIVNPAKLSIDRQFDICQRCHLQGNTILKEGKSFYDFKPGMVLSDYMTVFLPKYKNADDEFIMASHADRLKQSQCFIKSMEKAASGTSAGGGKHVLKPYKDAMTCITCHNPHVSVKETNKNVFNDACLKCHDNQMKDKRPEVKDGIASISNLFCSKKGVTKMANCISCHMPNSGSIDIPHVTVHDHYIRKPLNKKDKQGLKEFIGLYAINEKNPAAMIKAKAYLNQYEKFEHKAHYLDSAAFYLNDKTDNDLKADLEPLVQLYFTKTNFQQIILYANRLTDDYLLKTKLINKSYSNDHAWTSYRIGEAFYKTGNVPRAVLYLKKAVGLAPFVLDFKNKYASALASNKQLTEAVQQYNEILKEHPKHVSALTNLGYVKLSQGNLPEAENLYNKALKLDPDYEPLLLNLAGLYAYQQNFIESKKYLNRILSLNPNSQQAKQALSQIQGMH
jgi:predicted CXXCH cytochrome family protein